MSWQEYCETVASADLEFPHLATACLAQAMLESGRETSELAKLHHNYHGMKWRDEMRGIATPVEYQTSSEPTGQATFCKFASKADEVRGYWQFLERPPYQGWRDHTNNPEEFLAFIGPIWCAAGYTKSWQAAHGGLNYHEYILQKFYKEAEDLLSEARRTPYRELRKGEQGDLVKLLQRELNEHNNAGLKVDGIFGNLTEQAVMAVERRLQMPIVDGIADIDVWKALLELTPPPPPDKTLWIPFAQRLPEIPTAWTYEQGYPQGAVIHFTAGRDNPIATIEYLAKMGFPCLVMGRDGLIYQSFPLNRGGCHSGTIHHRYSVGIEIIAAGRCIPVTINGQKLFAPWFTYDQQGNLQYPDVCLPESEMHYVEQQGSQREGWYQKYTQAQEDSLIQLLLWLKSQAPDIFSFDKVKGHDECCDEDGRPGQKSDPGGALSMTMPEFRELLKDKYAESLN